MTTAKEKEYIDFIKEHAMSGIHIEEAPLKEIRYIGKEYPKKIQLFTSATQHIIGDTFEEVMDIAIDKLKRRKKEHLKELNQNT